VTANLAAPATPLVRKTAERLGVGGRVRIQDVQAAAGRRRPLALATRPRPSLQVQQRSIWSSQNRSVTIDVFAANPLADDLRQVDPARYEAAKRRGGPVPTVFVTGDLPAATTAGIDPQLLAGVPYVARHALMNAAAGDAVAMLEAYGAATADAWDAAYFAHCLDPGILAYEHRLTAWAAEWR
jgi:hypothetical protein